MGEFDPGEAADGPEDLELGFDPHGRITMREYGKRDPSSHRTPGQITKMDRGYNHRPTIIKDRTERNQARTIMRKEKGEAAIAGKDIDHKRMVNQGRREQRAVQSARSIRARQPRLE